MATPVQQIARKLFSPKIVTTNLCISPSSRHIQKLFLPTTPNSSNSSENKNIPFINTPQKGKILNSGLVEKNWKILGRGKFGIVFQGFYKDDLVAVKVVSNKNSLQREKNCLKLKHRNIVSTIQIISEPSKNFAIVLMCYYRNSKSLQTLLDDSNFILSKRNRLGFALDISSGLKYCHENDIIHMDVKPKNVLIGEDGICRICDFGNSIEICSDWQLKNYDLGTVYYVAPELFCGECPTKKCDIYSLGITFWQIDARDVPFKNLDIKEAVIYEVVKNDKRPILPKICDNFTNLYRKCWKTNPNQRPAATEIFEEIKLELNCFKSM